MVPDRPVSPWWVVAVLVAVVALVALGLHTLNAHQHNADVRIERGTP